MSNEDEDKGFWRWLSRFPHGVITGYRGEEKDTTAFLGFLEAVIGFFGGFIMLEVLIRSNPLFLIAIPSLLFLMFLHGIYLMFIKGG